MRVLKFDQFEFDCDSSEESLEIHVAMKCGLELKVLSDVRKFVAASAGPGTVNNLRGPVFFQDQAGFSSIREYLRRFAGIIVPDPCEWQMFVLFEDDLEWDGVLEAPNMFIRYHWLSTA